MPSAAVAGQSIASPAQRRSQQSTAVTGPAGARPDAVRQETHLSRAEFTRYVRQASHCASHAMPPAGARTREVQVEDAP